MKRMSLLSIVLLFAVVPVFAQKAGVKTCQAGSAVVNYSGISDPYARALARVADTARSAAVNDFAFQMPETVRVEAVVGPTVRLFNDGNDYMSLTVRSEKDLRRPSQSGIFNIYGICHEVGHIAMYRLVTDRVWMTTAAAEGWAHYMGSRLVDTLYERAGGAVWPDRYDYRSDGMRRLKSQLASPSRSDIDKGAGIWMELAGIVGDKGVAPIFAAWGKVKIDLADPGASLRKELLAVNSDRRLAAWWNKAEPLFIRRVPKSSVERETLATGDGLDPTVELSRDDGASAGVKSMSGGGHAVRFEAPADGYFLTSVRIFGSRYGNTPADYFHVYLCDDALKTIADFPCAYGAFDGTPKWVTLPAEPTRVPKRFFISVSFNPTQTKGVFVHYDKKGSGNSFVGLPGQSPANFDAGDWMIRAVVAPLKAPSGSGDQDNPPVPPSSAK